MIGETMPEQYYKEPVLTQFYMNQQVREFIEFGYISFSNPLVLRQYEENLMGNKLEYKIVRGLGDSGLTIVVCKPEKFRHFMNRLDAEIERTEKILAKKKAAKHS
jgi:hypothetical protein